MMVENTFRETMALIGVLGSALTYYRAREPASRQK